MQRNIASLAVLLVFGCAGVVHAQDTKVDTKAPGTEATEAMGSQVPNMKGECADNAKVDTKAPGTEATEAMGSQVPTMKQADGSDCVDGQKSGADASK